MQPPAHDILDPINVLTFGLLVFAAAQVWVTWRGEVAKRHEREEEDQERQRAEHRGLDLAYQTVWAEHFRLDALADSWGAGDLVQMSLSGILRADDLLPRDWSTQMAMLGRLGTEASYLGGVAITLAYDLARQVVEFNQSQADLFVRDDERTAGLKAIHVRATVGGSRLAMYEQRLKTGVRELATLTWDAIQHSPRGDIARTLRFRDDLQSEMGRQAVKALASRSEPSAGTPGDVRK